MFKVNYCVQICRGLNEKCKTYLYIIYMINIYLITGDLTSCFPYMNTRKYIDGQLDNREGQFVLIALTVNIIKYVLLTKSYI